MSRVLAACLSCLFLGGCALTGSDGEATLEPPAAELIAYSGSSGDGELAIWVVRVDGTGKKRLGRGTAPAISPDGRWVAYQGGRSSRFEFGLYHDLMLVAASGGRPRLLMRGVGQPVWSPDSKRLIAIQRLDDSRRALLAIEIETGERTTLARGPIGDWGFSPSGEEVVYTRGAVFGKVDVYAADADGGNERRVTHDGSSAYPVWGPRDIAFARIVPYRGWGAHETWLVRPDGSARRLLTKTPPSLLGQGITGLVPVAWSADGRSLLAMLTNEMGGIPFAVNPRTGAVRRLGDYSYHALPRGLSRDGRSVLVSESGYGLPDRSRIEVVPYAGGAGRLVVRHTSEASWNR